MFHEMEAGLMKIMFC